MTDALRAYVQHKAECDKATGRYGLGGECRCSCGLDAVLAAPHRLYEPNVSWQPIETAPKDGSVVIGFDRAGDDQDDELFSLRGVEFMRWLDGSWLDPTTFTRHPTHWMPLPDPPTAAEPPPPWNPAPLPVCGSYERLIPGERDVCRHCGATKSEHGLALAAAPPPVKHLKHGNSTFCGAARERGNSFYEWAYVNCADCLAKRRAEWPTHAFQPSSSDDAICGVCGDWPTAAVHAPGGAAAPPGPEPR